MSSANGESSDNQKAVMHTVSWTLVLAVFWLLLSGYLKPLLLGFGFVSVILVVFILQRMNHSDGLNLRLPLNFRFFRYIAWLMGQIVVSSLAVTRLVWSKNKKLSPAIAKLPVTNSSAKTHVLYANSITLTPGTLSVDIDDEHVTVHALVEKSIEELKAGEMAGKVSAVAGEKN